MKNAIWFILVSLLVFSSCKKDDSNPTSPIDDASTVTYSGKVYHSVKIGNQTWLKENLNVGVMIDSMQNPSNNGTIEKYCYRNDTANCTKYGGLYQWNEAMAYDTIERVKGICPTGWHIPTRAELDTLAAAVHNNGNSLKAVGEGTGSGAGTDSSGFSAVLAGGRYGNDYFDGLGYGAYFWSSTEITAPFVYNVFLWSTYSGISMDGNLKGLGFSIRCLKD